MTCLWFGASPSSVSTLDRGRATGVPLPADAFDVLHRLRRLDLRSLQSGLPTHIPSYGPRAPYHYHRYRHRYRCRYRYRRSGTGAGTGTGTRHLCRCCRRRRRRRRHKARSGRRRRKARSGGRSRKARLGWRGREARSGDERARTRARAPMAHLHACTAPSRPPTPTSPGALPGRASSRQQQQPSLQPPPQLTSGRHLKWQREGYEPRPGTAPLPLALHTCVRAVQPYGALGGAVQPDGALGGCSAAVWRAGGYARTHTRTHGPTAAAPASAHHSRRAVCIRSPLQPLQSITPLEEGDRWPAAPCDIRGTGRAMRGTGRAIRHAHETARTRPDHVHVRVPVWRSTRRGVMVRACAARQQRRPDRRGCVHRPGRGAVKLRSRPEAGDCMHGSSVNRTRRKPP